MVQRFLNFLLVILLLAACNKKDITPMAINTVYDMAPTTLGRTVTCQFTHATEHAFYNTANYWTPNLIFFGPVQFDTVIYQSNGLPAKAITSLGNTITEIFFSYNTQNKLTVLRKHSINTNDWEYIRFTYTGNQTQIQQTYSYYDAVKNYSYVHDEQGRVIQLNFPPNADGSQNYFKYQYATTGNLRAIRLKTSTYTTEQTYFVFSTFDSRPNAFGAYPWNLLLQNYSINNPVRYICYNDVDGSVVPYNFCRYQYQYNTSGYPTGSIRHDSLVYKGQAFLYTKDFTIKYPCN